MARRDRNQSGDTAVLDQEEGHVPDETSPLLDPNEEQLGPDEDTDEEEDTTSEDEDDEEEIPETNSDGTRNVVLKTGITADKSAGAKPPFTGIDRTYKQVFVMPGAVQGYVDRYGEETILDLIESSVVARTRAAARKPLEEGWPDEEIEKLCLSRASSFGERKTRGPRDPKDVVRRKLQSIEDPEERRAFLAELAAEVGL